MDSKSLAGLFTVLAILGVTGCRVDTNKNGDNKDVKIATPFGGLQVKTDDKAAAGDLGLTVYPGATPVKKDEGGDSGSADVNMSFGSFQMRVKTANYRTQDSPEKVEAFYRNDMKRFGDVITCHGSQAVGMPVQTSDGLTCSEDHGKHVKVDTGSGTHNLDLKAGSRQHQHVVGIQREGGGTKIGLVALDLPKMFSDDKSDGDRQ